MIYFSRIARLQLESIKDRFVDRKNKNEFGRSAFWLWIDKITNDIKRLELLPTHAISTTPNIFYLSIDEWGIIYYRVQYVSNSINFRIESFKFNYINLFKWMAHKPIDIPNKTWEITKYPSGLPNIAIVCSNANLYTWFNTITNKLVNPKKWYCEIGEFNSLGNTYVCVRSKSGNEYYRFIDKTLHYLNKNKYLQIGVSPKGNYYVQYPNKRFQILKPDLTPLDGFYYENVIVNNGCMYGEINGEDYLVETKLYKEKPKHQKITLTENQFYNFILNCVNKVLKTT